VHRRILVEVWSQEPRASEREKQKRLGVPPNHSEC
jgi:hypothetical protein